DSAASPSRQIPGFGEPAPFFAAPTSLVARYNFGVAAGRWVVLMVFGTLEYAVAAEALAVAMRDRDLFNDADAAFFGVSMDPADRDQRGLRDSEPGVRFFWDFDSSVGRLYGLADDGGLRPAVFLLDPTLRVVMAAPLEKTADVLARLKSELAAAAGQAEATAPVLIMPRVFEPELCRILITYFEEGQPTESG